MLSGIGNAKYLQAMGISVVADLPGVVKTYKTKLSFLRHTRQLRTYTAITSSVAEAGLFFCIARG